MKLIIKRYLRILALTLAAATVATGLAGCGIISLNRPGRTEDSSTAEDTTGDAGENFEVAVHNYSKYRTRFLKDVASADHGGGTVKFVGVGADMIVPGDDTPAVLSEQLNDRNASVEKRLNVSVAAETRDVETLKSELAAAVKSGSYYADIIMIPQSYIGEFARDGLIMNLAGLPMFDSEKDYFTSPGAGGGNGVIYGIAGPASLELNCLSAVFFNKSIIEKTGLESPYKLVDRGEWTWDKFIEYANAAAEQEGVCGYTAQNTAGYLADIAYYSCGQVFVSSDSGAMPSIALESEEAAAAVSKIVSALNDTKSADGALTGIETFKSGGAAFLFESLSSLSILSDSAAEWGLLPLPKYSVEQENYVSLGNPQEACFFAVPVTVTDVQKVSDTIRAVNIYSYGSIVDASVENAAGFYLRDNDSIRMLRTVANGAAYDLAYSYANEARAIPSGTYMAVRNTVDEISTVDKYVNMWRDLFDSAMQNLFG